MKLQVRWTEHAASQLTAIVDFVARTSPVYAANLASKIVHRLETAAAFPESGRYVGEIGRADTRELIVPPYRVIYSISERALHVLAIVHSRRAFDDIRGSVRERQTVAYALGR